MRATPLPITDSAAVAASGDALSVARMIAAVEPARIGTVLRAAARTNDLEAGQLVLRRLNAGLYAERRVVVGMGRLHAAQSFLGDGAGEIGVFERYCAQFDRLIGIQPGIAIALQGQKRRAAVEMGGACRCVHRERFIVVVERTLRVAHARTEDAAIDQRSGAVAERHR